MFGMIRGLDGLLRWSGVGRDSASLLERAVSAIGGMVALVAVLGISQVSLGLHGAATLVASMGASAVLLFAVPHGPLSQPWSVFGGHMVSALAGVWCAQVIEQPLFAAALAVGLSIAAMHSLRCIHPPGGATALSAVVGGDAVHQLGFQFLLTPVMLNLVTILLVAVLFNAPFAWRRYPAAWAGPAQARTAGSPRPGSDDSKEGANE